ncbi:MAG TPA: asparagine synthase (glutamine-hydrolyzing) [Bauldia sp.]|nr:asparagine synthase (glutamine-hydrolyzing) [Bauldia sp.]
MCGIAGYYGSPEGRLPPRHLVGRMVDAIAHRGPDESGVHVEPGVGLGHARLSIVDLASGQQPMANAAGDLVVSFNGEIFNHVEIRAELAARGHVFRTGSDTEVILEAYAAMGPACVDLFNGDFAFALFDRRLNRLMLARDRMGVRPLFYTWRNGCLYFASEAKALFVVPGIDAEVDPIALDQVFTFWFPLAPRTPFKDVLELPPGHLMLAEAGGAVVVRPYWQLAFPDAADADGYDRRSEGEIAEELHDLLLDATRIRLRADVPVGAYLSGGLDSSIIAAAVHRLVPGRLRTFSVTFETPEFDESAWQFEMVRALGTDHMAIPCRSADIGRMFPDVIRATERPVLRTAPAPLFALSELVHDNGFKVVLTGEGADEVFAGYDIFKEAKLRRFCARQPDSKWRPRLFERLYPYLPGLKGQSQSYRQAFFGAGMDETGDPLFSHMPRFKTTAGAKAFYSAGLRGQLAGYDALDDLRASLPADFMRWHSLAQAQYLETAFLLPGYILSAQGDRVAMAHAVEGRFPFLDHRVVEFAAKIPPRLKMKGLREKHILRQAMADLLPGTIGNRTKQPYRAPDSQCFTGAGAPAYVGEMLSADAVAGAGLFDPRAVGKLATKVAGQNFVGFRDNMAFVGILSTQLLDRAFVRRAETGIIQSAVA